MNAILALIPVFPSLPAFYAQTSALTLALIGHLVGDYLLQNDWMALNKKKSSFHCVIHCLIWAICVISFAGWYGPHDAHWFNGEVFTILFVTHFLQDRTNIVAWWMDLIGQKSFRTGICAPWSIIVVDNVWHIVTIWAVWKFVI